MSALARRSRRNVTNYWPGFVDAFAALLIVVIFLVMVFVLAQFFLSEALSGRDQALSRLDREINELTSMLDLERSANSDLRLTVTQLSAELQNSLGEREVFEATLAQLRGEREAALSEQEALGIRLAAIERDMESAQLAAEIANAENLSVRAELEDAFKVIDADKEKITLQLAQLDSLTRDIAVLSDVRAQLEVRVAELAQGLDVSREELEVALAQITDLDADLLALRDRSQELQAQLSTEQERTALAQREIEDRDINLRELLVRAETAELSFLEQTTISQEAQQRAALLNQQLGQLRLQIAALNEALEASEARNADQEVVIADLGSRLNQALATKVQELARYRSEFFGRLRELLGDREDVRIVGDRFVFQSEVLFNTGESALEDAGKLQLLRLSNALQEIALEIPGDIDWVIRVDGHTDVRPINTPRFPSNWELSAARAISVVQYLVQQGIGQNRLVAAGFGEHHPLDVGRTEDAFRKNRRIEFKLTER